MPERDYSHRTFIEKLNIKDERRIAANLAKLPELLGRNG
jgi:hypothetical protein